MCYAYHGMGLPGCCVMVMQFYPKELHAASFFRLLLCFQGPMLHSLLQSLRKYVKHIEAGARTAGTKLRFACGAYVDSVSEVHAVELREPPE